MLYYVEPLPAGNAVRLFIRPPRGGLEWRVLRRVEPGFTGHDDPGAVRLNGPNNPRPEALTDTAGLINGQRYFYCLFHRTAAGWVQGDSVGATPAATYQGDGADVQAIVRERLELGLAVEVARGALKPTSGKIQVLTAPFAGMSAVNMPCVSVHLDTCAPTDHFIGDSTEPDWHLGGDGPEDEREHVHVIGTGWEQDTGWLEQVRLNVIGVSLNMDERAALRRALRRVLQANLPVFAEAGMTGIEFTQHDTEDLGGEKNALLYMSAGTFSCRAPASISAPIGEVADVTVHVNPFGAEPNE